VRSGVSVEPLSGRTPSGLDSLPVGHAASPRIVRAPGERNGRWRRSARGMDASLAHEAAVRVGKAWAVLVESDRDVLTGLTEEEKATRIRSCSDPADARAGLDDWRPSGVLRVESSRLGSRAGHGCKIGGRRG
jgi:hypothetical protein